MDAEEVRRVTILVSKITRLKAQLDARDAELAGAVQTIREMAHERWPAGGRN